MGNKTLKERLHKGHTVLGTWSIIPSPDVVEIIGSCGFDFVVIDSEHGPVSPESAVNLLRAAESSGIEALIRVPYNDPSLILRALDIGASGVQVPHVSTKEEARSAVESTKYYPQGKRGLSPFTRSARYGLDAQGHAGRSNRKTLVVLNIEGRQGFNNLKEIVKVAGIDVIFIGPYDLSQSLGRPGQVEDRQIIRSIKQSVAIAEAEGIACGSFARDEKYLDILLDCGVRYLTYMVDSFVIVNSYRALAGSPQKRIARRKTR